MGQLGPERIQEPRGLARLVTVEQHEQLPDPGVVGPRRDVVVNPRIVMADRGINRLNPRRTAQHPLSEPGGRIRHGDTRALGRRDVNAELRRLGLRKQREAHHRDERERRRDERGAECQRAGRPPQRPVEQRRIGAVDRALERPQEAVPLRPFVLTEQQARKPRDDREGHDQRRQHGADHRDGQRPDVAAGSARKEHQRYEREHERRRRAQHRDPDLPRGADRRLDAGVALPPEPRDVLDHHDRVVHQQAERDHHPHDRELVEGEAGPREPRHCHGERQGYRDHDDGGGPRAQR